MMVYAIEDLLSEDMIFVDLEATNSDELIRLMGERAMEKGIVSEGFAKAVIEREREYPTALPTTILKVAIPHPMDQSTVNKSAIIISKLKTPVPFREMGSFENKIVMVDTVFMLALNGSKDQLKILQELVSIFSEDDKMQKIKDALTPKDICISLKQILSQ